jgi:hypothetical protein
MTLPSYMTVQQMHYNPFSKLRETSSYANTCETPCDYFLEKIVPVNFFFLETINKWGQCLLSIQWSEFVQILNQAT